MGDNIGKAAYSSLASITQLFGSKISTVLKWEAFTATAGQTVFTLTTGEYNIASDSILVWVGGSIQLPGTDFAKTSSTSFTLTSGATVGTDVLVAFFETVDSTGDEFIIAAGAPDNGTGSNGDVYINSTNFDIYQKAAGAWGSAIGSIKGATGAAGAAGVSDNSFLTVNHSGNTYTLSLANSITNFKITSADANAKTIAFSNVPATSGLSLAVVVNLVCTTAATFTHPAGTVWVTGSAPTFTTGKQYLLSYVSFDNGTSWLASSVGGW